MRAVVQRVSSASVTVDTEVVGSIGAGLLVLLGVGVEDTSTEAQWLDRKIAGLRIFRDDEQRMNRSVQDVGGSVLVVSQFTLYGDARKGTRPSFTKAAGEDLAVPLYEEFCELMRAEGLPVETGRFGAMMDVSLVNDGPVTIVLDRDPRPAGS